MIGLVGLVVWWIKISFDWSFGRLARQRRAAAAGQPQVGVVVRKKGWPGGSASRPCPTAPSCPLPSHARHQVATFPTCHDPTLRELLRLNLPQRYIALVGRLGGLGLWGSAGSGAGAAAAADQGGVASGGGRAPRCTCPRAITCSFLTFMAVFPAQVHNPEYLNSTDVAQMVQQHDIRLLAISPHVGEYARQVMAAQGMEVRALGLGEEGRYLRRQLGRWG